MDRLESSSISIIKRRELTDSVSNTCIYHDIQLSAIKCYKHLGNLFMLVLKSEIGKPNVILLNNLLGYRYTKCSNNFTLDT